MFTIITCAIIWFACGFIAAGYEFAYWQRRYPMLSRYTTKTDASHAWIDVILGCAALFVVVARGHNNHGWKLWFGKGLYEY